MRNKKNKLAFIPHFNKRLDSLCGTNELRPSLQYIFFIDEYLYLTNAYVALKQNLELYNFNEQLKSIFNNKKIHSSVFKFIYKKQIFIKDNKPYVKINPYIEIEIPLSDIEEKENNIYLRHIINIINDTSEINTDFALNPKYLHQLTSCMFNINNHYELNYHKGDNGIFIKVVYQTENEIGILMPVILNKWKLR